MSPIYWTQPTCVCGELLPTPDADWCVSCQREVDRESAHYQPMVGTPMKPWIEAEGEDVRTPEHRRTR